MAPNVKSEPLIFFCSGNSAHIGWICFEHLNVYSSLTEDVGSGQTSRASADDANAKV